MGKGREEMAGGAEAEVAAVVSKWDSRDLGWALAKAGEGQGRQLRAETREGYGTSSTEEWRRVMGCGPGVTASARRGRRGSGWKGTLGSLPGGGEAGLRRWQQPQPAAPGTRLLLPPWGLSIGPSTGPCCFQSSHSGHGSCGCTSLALI